MPRYRENYLSTPFSMFCSGISQNTRHHHLTLYKGQVWGNKSYPELCGNNILTIVYSSRDTSTEDIMEQNGKLYVPSLPGIGFNNDDFTQIPWNSEILQSFSHLTRITQITFLYYDPSWQNDGGTEIDEYTYQIHVGSFKCKFDGGICGCDSEGCFRCSTAHKHQCVPPHSHKTWYIWTKECFKI